MGGCSEQAFVLWHCAILQQPFLCAVWIWKGEKGHLWAKEKILRQPVTNTVMYSTWPIPAVHALGLGSAANPLTPSCGLSRFADTLLPALQGSCGICSAPLIYSDWHASWEELWQFMVVQLGIVFALIAVLSPGVTVQKYVYIFRPQLQNTLAMKYGDICMFDAVRVLHPFGCSVVILLCSLTLLLCCSFFWRIVLHQKGSWCVGVWMLLFAVF